VLKYFFVGVNLLNMGEIVQQISRILIFSEMLFINLITTHRCATKKYSTTKIIVGLILFTVFIFFTLFLIREKYGLAYLPANALILSGFSYFFILNHLYRESYDKILAIMFFSWIHTLTVTHLSMQLSTLFQLKNYFQVAFMLQTIIYLFSTPFIIKFTKKKFLYILRNIPIRMNKYLIILSSAEFTTLSFLYLFLNEKPNSYWKIIIGLLLALTAVISYQLIYIIVKNSKNINLLKHLAYRDSLTGIKNRLSLFVDCDEYISENNPFTLVYMDLNHFKSVNDTYGHSVGDEYLKRFTKTTIGILGNKGNIYRMSGDEFICLYEGNKIDAFLELFNNKVSSILGMNIPFMGVSIGYARFPQDAIIIDELIKKADKVMYEVKKTQKVRDHLFDKKMDLLVKIILLF